MQGEPVQYEPLQQQYSQGQPLMGQQYENQQEQVFQGKGIEFFQVNFDQRTGQYTQQRVDANLIVKNDQAQAQLMNQIQQSKYPNFDQQQTNKVEENNDDKKVREDGIKFIIHDVTPADTLIGLSIRYNVSEFKIKQFNNLDSEEIWFKKQLKIPNPTTNIMNDEHEKDFEGIIRRKLIGQFKQDVLLPKDRSEKMAHYYLSESEWDLVEATKLYKEDIEWESKAEKGGKIVYNNLKKNQ